MHFNGFARYELIISQFKFDTFVKAQVKGQIWVMLNEIARCYYSLMAAIVADSHLSIIGVHPFPAVVNEEYVVEAYDIYSFTCVRITDI